MGRVTVRDGAGRGRATGQIFPRGGAQTEKCERELGAARGVPSRPRGRRFIYHCPGHHSRFSQRLMVAYSTHIISVSAVCLCMFVSYNLKAYMPTSINSMHLGHATSMIAGGIASHSTDEDDDAATCSVHPLRQPEGATTTRVLFLMLERGESPAARPLRWDSRLASLLTRHGPQDLRPFFGQHEACAAIWANFLLTTSHRLPQPHVARLPSQRVACSISRVLIFVNRCVAG